MNTKEIPSWHNLSFWSFQMCHFTQSKAVEINCVEGFQSRPAVVLSRWGNVICFCAPPVLLTVQTPRREVSAASSVRVPPDAGSHSGRGWQAKQARGTTRQLSAGREKTTGEGPSVSCDRHVFLCCVSKCHPMLRRLGQGAACLLAGVGTRWSWFIVFAQTCTNYTPYLLRQLSAVETSFYTAFECCTQPCHSWDWATKIRHICVSNWNPTQS